MAPLSLPASMAALMLAWSSFSAMTMGLGDYENGESRKWLWRKGLGLLLGNARRCCPRSSAEDRVSVPLCLASMVDNLAGALQT